MELASPSSEEPVTQIEADVPIEPIPLQADATHLDLDLHVYKRPLAVTPFGTPEVVPDWQETHAMRAFVGDPCLGKWIRTDLGVRTFQGLGKNGRSCERTSGSSCHSRFDTPELFWKTYLVILIFRCLCTRKCLPDCGPTTCHTWDIQTTFVYRLFPRFSGPDVLPPVVLPSRLRSGGGGGVPPPFQNLLTPQSLSAVLWE